MTPIRICIVSPYAHALFTGQPRRFGGVEAYGGAEVQQRLIALGLAARGVDVRFVSYAEGEPREESCEGVRFFTIPMFAGSTWQRHVAGNLALWGALGRGDADVYYQRCAGLLTGVVAAFSRHAGCPFIFSVANDRDLDGRYLDNAPWHEGILYRLGLRLATEVVVQSRFQEKLLGERWGREGVLIPSACPLPKTPPLSARSREGVLWVGSLLRKKRPELLADLARALPAVPFTVIAPLVGEPGFIREIQDRLSGLPNVRHVESVPYQDMPAHYRRAAVLVSTSHAEGFPNVFVESWAARMPVISLDIDPDELICREGLGIHARSVVELAEGTQRLLTDAEAREEIGVRAEAYVRRCHAPEVVAERYEDLLRRCLSKAPQGGNEGS